MKYVIKKDLVKTLSKIKWFLKIHLLDGYASKSYSQEGEDMILQRIFKEKKNGFYVDVGAHHPKRFSNTYYFYKRGWNGINIDAMPGSMKIFKRQRSRDINLEIAVSSKSGTLIYYIFNEPALNGFDLHLAQKRNSTNNKYKIIDRINLKVRSLASILEEFLPKNTQIDFMSIDVEGFDLDVLVSNNWNKYRPTIILAEVLGCSLSEVEASEITTFLSAQGYQAYAKTANTVIYQLKENI